MADYEDYQGEYEGYDEYYDEPQGRSRTWLIVAIVAAVVLLCCCCLALVVGYFILQPVDISDALSALVGATVFV